jgi:hypothetical protein
MGLDYSYLLFFERRARFDVLDRLAEIAEPDLENQTTLILPDQVITLPFEGWLETGRRIEWDDPNPKWDFMTVLRFEVDEAIANYLDRREAGWREVADDADVELPEMAGLGYIYLTVYNDLRALSERLADPGLVLFEFDTPGTSMSILFTESTAIRQAFIHLLETCQGVYGVLDMENEAEVIWFKGEEVSVVIPHAYLSLPEIEAYVRGKS